MTMTFHNRVRLGLPERLPALVRMVAKHEGGHGLGLDNADDCPAGSTIMNLNHNDGIEDQISNCDNLGVNNDPRYPPPQPTPASCKNSGSACIIIRNAATACVANKCVGTRKLEVLVMGVLY